MNCIGIEIEFIIITTPVAAAASLPSSLTSTNSLQSAGVAVLLPYIQFLTNNMYPTLILLQWVTEKSNLMINARDRLGRSPLLVGLMSGAGSATVRELLAAGERIDLEDDVGRSPAQEGEIFLFLQRVS